MPSNVMIHRGLKSAEITAVGIDVGGEQKGFHAVALIGGNYACRLATKDVPELSRWCRKTIRPLVIAIDAPCRWSDDGRARPAERAAHETGYFMFFNPDTLPLWSIPLTISAGCCEEQSYFMRSKRTFHCVAVCLRRTARAVLKLFRMQSPGICGAAMPMRPKRKHNAGPY